MIEKLLQDLWFTPREARIYLAWLETWLAPASKIASKAWEKRVTAYQILEQMWSRWRLREIKKNSVSQYDMLTPNELVKLYDDTISKLRDKVPEMVGLMNQYASKPKVEYYEGREQLKNLFQEILQVWYSMEMPFYTFVWVSDMDPKFEQRLQNDFTSLRLECPTETLSLISKHKHSYSDYVMQHHEYRMIKDPIFDFTSEIILYWSEHIALVSYTSDDLNAVVIQSKNFYEAMKWIFLTVRNLSE